MTGEGINTLYRTLPNVSYIVWLECGLKVLIGF
jgi:hypothetical protein